MAFCMFRVLQFDVVWELSVQAVAKECVLEYFFYLNSFSKSVCVGMVAFEAVLVSMAAARDTFHLSTVNDWFSIHT